MAKNKFYAYLIEGKTKGITDNWPACQAAVKGKKARYKGFVTEQEARDWLSGGAVYEKKEKVEVKLEPGIYFDAGTGRGIGVEVRLTDHLGRNIFGEVIDPVLLNEFGNFSAPPGSTNNYGELLGCYFALKLAIKAEVSQIFGDSKLVLDYWSKGHIKKDNVAEVTVKLAQKTALLRQKFELKSGRIIHVSGDYNPADLGFHK